MGRYPTGSDDVAAALARELRAAGFDSEPRGDISRWKYGKLLDNLGNSLEAICGPAARSGRAAALARAEGIACLRAAGIAYAERDVARSEAIRPRPIGGQTRPGGSTW